MQFIANRTVSFNLFFVQPTLHMFSSAFPGSHPSSLLFFCSYLQMITIERLSWLTIQFSTLRTCNLDSIVKMECKFSCLCFRSFSSSSSSSTTTLPLVRRRSEHHLRVRTKVLASNSARSVIYSFQDLQPCNGLRTVIIKNRKLRFRMAGEKTNERTKEEG